MKHIGVILFLFLPVILRAQDVPFMKKSDYDLVLDYNFKTKPPPESEDVNLINFPNNRADVLPYVKVYIKFLNIPENAFKVKVIDNRHTVIKNKKLKQDFELLLDLGFAEDIKDRINAHIYKVFLVTKDKKQLSKITIRIDESGDFFVNEELFGKL